MTYPPSTKFVSEKVSSSNDPDMLLMHAVQPEGTYTECGNPALAHPSCEPPHLYSRMCPYCIRLLAVRMNEKLVAR